MSGVDTFRTWRDVRLESVMRSKADVIDHSEFMDSRPGLMQVCEASNESVFGARLVGERLRWF